MSEQGCIKLKYVFDPDFGLRLLWWDGLEDEWVVAWVHDSPPIVSLEANFSVT